MSDQIGRIEFGPQYAEVGPWTLPGALIPVDMDTTAKLAKALNTALNEKADAECRERGLQMEIERLTAYAEALVALLKESKQPHYECEDSWYSCPKSKEGCTNTFWGDDCNCGADAWNAKVDALLSVNELVTSTPPSVSAETSRSRSPGTTGADTLAGGGTISQSGVGTQIVQRGRWSFDYASRTFHDSDFTHDVVLKMNGDFGSDEERKAYAAKVLQALDAAFADLRPKSGEETPAERYRRENPLGGPAKLFYAIGDRITAGEDFHFVLRDMGVALVDERPQTGNDSLAGFIRWLDTKGLASSLLGWDEAAQRFTVRWWAERYAEETPPLGDSK